jgi:hypothetical protein
MRGFVVGALIVLACGGSSTNVDGGADTGPKIACWADPRTTADRQCATNGDCAVVDHVADCCGSIVVNGVRVDQVNAIHNAETAANAGCAVCQCAAQPTVDENGTPGLQFVASCDTGLCTAHAQ